MAHISLDDFITAACVPRNASHSSGKLDQANNILAAHPDLPTSDIHCGAILGEAITVQRFIAQDAAAATVKGGPYNWDPLTHLCFSRYLRLDRSRSAGFLQAARALLDAGASANTGFFSNEHQPNPEFESVLYGAAGIAHHAELTHLLLERGADPNDGEVCYHTPEGWDNEALKILVKTNKLNSVSLATILLRKTDWHDFEGIKWLLEWGVDPNLDTHWGKTALHNAVLSDNDIEIFSVLLDHGADPGRTGNRSDVCRSAFGKTAIALAARRGRGDVLELFVQRGIALNLQGIEQLLAACARNDSQLVHSLAEREPDLFHQLRAEGGRWLAEFAGNGNTEGVRHLLDLGVDVRSVYEGDGYFGTPPNSTALHVAAWRGRHSTVKLLLERGALIDTPDGNGRTPLALAVRACVDSYWQNHRSPESVRALLQAGASVSGISFPCGYTEVDEMLKSHGAKELSTKSQTANH